MDYSKKCILITSKWEEWQKFLILLEAFLGLHSFCHSKFRLVETFPDLRTINYHTCNTFLSKKTNRRKLSFHNQSPCTLHSILSTPSKITSQEAVPHLPSDPSLGPSVHLLTAATAAARSPRSPRRPSCWVPPCAGLSWLPSSFWQRGSSLDPEYPLNLQCIRFI